MKIRKKQLNKKGFSVVEIVVAVVVVVAVAGLGLFAYNNRNTDSSSSNSASSNNSDNNDTSKVETNDTFDTASAAYHWKFFGRSSSGTYLARACRASQVGQKFTIRTQIMKNTKGNTTIQSTSVKAYQKSGKLVTDTTLGKKWWLGFVQQTEKVYSRNATYKLRAYFGATTIGNYANLDDIPACA